MPQEKQKSKPSVQRGLNIGEDLLSYLQLANQVKGAGDSAYSVINRQLDKKAVKSGGKTALKERRSQPPSKLRTAAKAVTDVRPQLKGRIVNDLPTQLDYAHQTYQAFNPKEMEYGYQEGYETPDDPSDDYQGSTGKDYTYNQLLSVALKNGLNVGTDIGIDVLAALASKGKGVGPASWSKTAQKNVAGGLGQTIPPAIQVAKDYQFQHNVEPLIDKAIQRSNLGAKAAHRGSEFLKDFDLVFGTKAHGAAKQKVDEAFDFMGGASKFESNFPISRARRGESGELDPRYGDVGRILEMLTSTPGESPAQKKFMSDLQAKYKANDDKVLQPAKTAVANARQNVATTKTSLLGSLIGKIVQHFGQ
jgi:hypothetical protein